MCSLIEIAEAPCRKCKRPTTQMVTEVAGAPLNVCPECYSSGLDRLLAEVVEPTDPAPPHAKEVAEWDRVNAGDRFE